MSHHLKAVFVLLDDDNKPQIAIVRTKQLKSLVAVIETFEFIENEIDNFLDEASFITHLSPTEQDCVENLVASMLPGYQETIAK